MSKPADVSQRAWDESTGFARSACVSEVDTPSQFYALAEEIARSLDAAHAAGKAEQRGVDAAVDEKSLDERMKAAGMISLSEMLENKPFTRFQIHSGMTDLEFFEAWLVRRHKEFATMRMGYELGDKDKDDELFQWVFAHCAVYSDVLMQFRAAIRGTDKC